jgi:hypothetical protein
MIPPRRWFVGLPVLRIEALAFALATTTYISTAGVFTVLVFAFSERG